MNPAFWRNKTVFLTGHTGFKGGWLALWLQRAGARVHGYSLEPPTTPNLFSVADVALGLSSHTLADIRDAEHLKRAMAQAAPDIVFHLAAQPLVRHSYVDPLETYAVNVLGTAHLLEAVRTCPSVRGVVNVTTDKCYDNPGHGRPFQEGDPLGGDDPYSSSKAAAEMVTHAYRKSFLSPAGVGLASARAGNVIGGGDWAADRLVPDLLRASDSGEPLQVRNPAATRPWQHVLEPLSGYLVPRSGCSKRRPTGRRRLPGTSGRTPKTHGPSGGWSTNWRRASPARNGNATRTWARMKPRRCNLTAAVRAPCSAGARVGHWQKHSIARSTGTWHGAVATPCGPCASNRSPSTSGRVRHERSNALVRRAADRPARPQRRDALAARG